MPQQFERTQSVSQAQPAEEEQIQTQPVSTAKQSESLDALDAVLDDVETALEANAEEYVSSFVQKGGE